MTIKSGINTAQYNESLNQMKTTEAKGTKTNKKLTTGKQVKAETEKKTSSENLNNLMKESKPSSLNTSSNNIKQMDALSSMSELENFDI